MKIAEFQSIVIELAGSRKKGRPRLLIKRLKEYVKNKPSICPDERVFLEQTCQRIDEEKDPDQAWLMVNDISKAEDREVRIETDAAMLAITRNVQTCTVAYMDVEKHEQASGTLVEINNRIFLATTAHSVPPNPIGRIAIIGMNSAILDEQRPNVLSFNRELRNDVAYLEIERRFVDQRLVVCQA